MRAAEPFSASGARDVSASSREVASLALDPAQFPYWLSDYRALANDDPGEVRAGAEYVYVMTYKPRREARVEVLELVPGAVLRCRSVEDDDAVEFEIALSSINDCQCRVTQAVVVQPARRSRLTPAYVEARIGRDLGLLAGFFSDDSEEDSVGDVRFPHQDISSSAVSALFWA